LSGEVRLADFTFAFQLADFFRFGVKYVEELYSQQPPKNSGGSWKCAFFPRAICICARANPNSILAALSTALSRALYSQFRHSTSRLLVEISLAVRTVEVFTLRLAHFHWQHPLSSVMLSSGSPRLQRRTRTILYTKFLPKLACPRGSSSSCQARHRKLSHRQSRTENLLGCTSRVAHSYSRSYGRT